jgi:AcrR family transcriptional regulator
MTSERKSRPTRERLLASAARLLAAHGPSVSTRAICEDAGVTAPTLYHYFGDRDGLLQAVVSHGFGEYLARKRSLESSGYPIEDLRRGWDDHTAWGRQNPAFYALMYGQVRPGHHAASADEAEQLLIEKLEVAARAGILRVPPAIASRMILAANVGLTLQIISQPNTGHDVAGDDACETVSARLRDAVLGSVLELPSERGPSEDRPVRVASIALRSALAATPPAQLASTELPLLETWLDRLASPASR